MPNRILVSFCRHDIAEVYDGYRYDLSCFKSHFQHQDLPISLSQSGIHARQHQHTQLQTQVSQNVTVILATQLVGKQLLSPVTQGQCWDVMYLCIYQDRIGLWSQRSRYLEPQ